MKLDKIYKAITKSGECVCAAKASGSRFPVPPLFDFMLPECAPEAKPMTAPKGRSCFDEEDLYRFMEENCDPAVKPYTADANESDGGRISRTSKISTVWFVGGEPCLCPDFPDVIRHIKGYYGVDAALYTDGFATETIIELMCEGLINRLGVEIKSGLSGYGRAAGTRPGSRALESLADTMNALLVYTMSPCTYYFAPLEGVHTDADIAEISGLLKGAYAVRIVENADYAAAAGKVLSGGSLPGMAKTPEPTGMQEAGEYTESVCRSDKVSETMHIFSVPGQAKMLKIRDEFAKNVDNLKIIRGSL